LLSICRDMGTIWFPIGAGEPLRPMCDHGLFDRRIPRLNPSSARHSFGGMTITGKSPTPAEQVSHGLAYLTAMMPKKMVQNRTDLAEHRGAGGHAGNGSCPRMGCRSQCRAQFIPPDILCPMSAEMWMRAFERLVPQAVEPSPARQARHYAGQLRNRSNAPISKPA